MALNPGNIYCIPEHPAEDLIAESHSEFLLSIKETNISRGRKKVSSTSLPEKQSKQLKHDLDLNRSLSNLTAPEIRIQQCENVIESKTVPRKISNRLSVSLIDFSDFKLTSDSGSLKTDKRNAFVNMASSYTSSAKNFESYLDIQDCITHPNLEPEYEKLLSTCTISSPNANPESNSITTSIVCKTNERKISDNFIIIDLNSDSDIRRSTEDIREPSGLRQRSGSMQWIQNTFQNVSNRYRFLLEFRRPSDIAEERMRKSKEEIEMEEHEYEVPETKQMQPPPGGRRFSENIFGKQKRFPFSSGLGHLKDLWRERNLVTKRQEEKDIDQTRTDVCPLFTFPNRKCDEDELVLDALRQAMRKCTAVDPTSRPTSTTVLDQLSKLLN